MPAYICTTCGTQYAPTPQPPASCPICLDERQYVTPAGQSWTTLDVLARRNMNAIHELEPGLISLLTFPHFGIGQRAMFLRTPHGNVLWDCIALVDRDARSEEHTSELQSQSNLVCRLLLEKKN